MKLRSKVAIGIILGATLSLTGIALLVFTLSRSQLRQSITANQNRTAHQAIDTVDRLLYERYLDVQVVATTPLLQNLLAGRVEADAKSQAIHRLKEQTLLSGPWDVLFAVDKTGNAIVSSRSGLPKTGNITTQPHNLAAYQAALKGEVYVSDLVMSDDTGKPTILFAAPIRDDKGLGEPVTGVVIGNFSWPVISAILRDIGHENPVHLYNSDGLILATNQLDDKSLFTKDEEDVPLIRQAISNNHAFFSIVKEGSRSPSLLISVAPSLGYLSYKGNNWALLIEAPTSTIFAPATKSAITTVELIIPIAVLAIGVILLLLNSTVINPILSLTKVVRAIAAGDMSIRADVKSSDEIGELGRSFNDMTDKLRAAYNSLEVSAVGIQNEKQILNTILNNLPVGVLVVKAPSGEPIMMNRVGKQISGRDVESGIGSSGYTKAYDVIKEDGSPYPTEDLPLTITLRTGKVMAKNDIILRRPDGSLVPIRTVTAPIKDADNVFRRAVSVFEDISKERVLERSREEFFSIASHELRTPLTAIRGNTSLIQEHYANELKDPDLRGMIKDIHESSVRLIEIVNDFLDTSRLEQNRITFHNEPFDPVELADGVIRGYQVTDSHKMLYLHLEPPKQPIAPVLADKNRVKQVLINLIGNGLKFTDQGGVTIRLEQQAGYAKISVQDTGRGIAPENQKLLFKKFQQATSNIMTRDTTQGTGLGLYISKLIIEGMGGQIHLERSRMGEGSTFSFTLPLAGTKTLPPQAPVIPGPLM